MMVRRPADIVLCGGVVHTLDAERPAVEAVAVRDGLIAGLGNDADVAGLIGPHTTIIGLAGRAVLPGFADAHAHVREAVSFLHALSLYGLDSLPGILDALREYSAAHRGKPALVGNGWSEALFPGAGPSRLDLDTVEVRRPVALWSDGHHSLWVNSEALRVLGISADTPDPATGVIERVEGTVGQPGSPHGEPSGTLRESAAESAMAKLPDFTVDEYCEGLRVFQDTIACPRGITLVHDPVLLPGCNVAAAYERLAAAGDLTMRVRASVQLFPDRPLEPQIAAAVAEREKHSSELFRVTAVKIFIDGVIEGHTGYLHEDYADRPGYRGHPIWSDGALAQACRLADAAGLQIHMHACGDAGLTQALDALARAASANGHSDRRPLVTHWQIVDPPDIARAAALGVVPLVQPYWFVKDEYYHSIQVPYLGAERAECEYPMRSLFAAGMRPASSSDYPVTPSPNPLEGMLGGVMRWVPEPVFGASAQGPGVLWPEEAVGIERAIESFTTNAAYANFLEGITGSLELGKSADLVVLARDPLTCAPAEIAANKVLLTLFRGREVYRHAAF